MMKKIAVLTSGGDCPGMNCAVRSVVRTAISLGATPYGIRGGYKGMIENDIFEMKRLDVANIISRGGTILQSARSKEFRTPEGRAKAAANLKANGIEGIVVIGGDGSLTGATMLEKEHGIKSVGIPGSIDNDIYGSDVSLGVDTALNTIMGMVDMLNNTASSHSRTFIVEVMGRGSGYLAVMSGVVTGADAVIIPEIKPDIKAIADNFNQRVKDGKTRNILIVAEGAGSAYDFAEQLKQYGDFDTRVTVLGHIQRGGAPTHYDRLLGSKMGATATFSLVRDGISGAMAGLQGQHIKMIPYDDVFSNKHEINKNIVKLLEMLG